MADREAAKQIILKIVAMAGGRLEAMSRLNKAFYAAHLIYWQERQGVLSDYPVVKLPHGPAIDDFDSLVSELVGEGALAMDNEMVGPYPTTVLTLKASVKIDPKAPEFEPIRRAVRWVTRHTVAELKRLTHDRPSYLAQPKVGYEQPIYLDAINEEELGKAKAVCAEIDEAFRVALGT